MERIRRIPPIIRELRDSGFTIRVSRHQSNEALISAMVDTIRSVPQRGSIQIVTQETLQYPPSTIYDARRGESRVLCAISETADPLHTYNMIFVNTPFGIVQEKPQTTAG